MTSPSGSPAASATTARPRGVIAANAARRSVGQGRRSIGPVASTRSASRVNPPLARDHADAFAGTA